MEKKTVKEVKIHQFLICAYKSQDFAQSKENVGRSHDRETVTFRNSAVMIYIFVSSFLLLQFKPKFRCNAILFGNLMARVVYGASISHIANNASCITHHKSHIRLNTVIKIYCLICSG